MCELFKYDYYWIVKLLFIAYHIFCKHRETGRLIPTLKKVAKQRFTWWERDISEGGFTDSYDKTLNSFVLFNIEGKEDEVFSHDAWNDKMAPHKVRSPFNKISRICNYVCH